MSSVNVKIFKMNQDEKSEIDGTRLSVPFPEEPYFGRWESINEYNYFNCTASYVTDIRFGLTITIPYGI